MTWENKTSKEINEEMDKRKSDFKANLFGFGALLLIGGGILALSGIKFGFVIFVCGVVMIAGGTNV